MIVTLWKDTISFAGPFADLCNGLEVIDIYVGF